MCKHGPSVADCLCSLALQKQFNAERVAALLEDRRIREQDEQAHASLAAQRIDELQQRLKNTERALQQATKDYILGRQPLRRNASQLQHASGCATEPPAAEAGQASRIAASP